MLLFLSTIALALSVAGGIAIAARSHAWTLLVLPVVWAILPWGLNLLMPHVDGGHCDLLPVLAILPFYAVSFIPAFVFPGVPTMGLVFLPPQLFLCSVFNFILGFAISAAFRW